MKTTTRSASVHDTRLKLGQQGDGSHLGDEAYDRRRLSYATTFTNPLQQKIIQAMELATGKLKLLRLIRNQLATQHVGQARRRPLHYGELPARLQ